MTLKPPIKHAPVVLIRVLSAIPMQIGSQKMAEGGRKTKQTAAMRADKNGLSVITACTPKRVKADSREFIVDRINENTLNQLVR